MRALDAVRAFEQSGLGEPYRVVAELAASGDAFACELLGDAIRACTLRALGLESFENYQRRRARRERGRAIDATETRGNQW
jgi:hypothetical protein